MIYDLISSNYILFLYNYSLLNIRRNSNAYYYKIGYSPFIFFLLDASENIFVILSFSSNSLSGSNSMEVLYIIFDIYTV